MRPSLLLTGLVLLPFVLFSQSPLDKIRGWRMQQEDRLIRQEFLPFLSIPNVATDKDNILKNATHLTGLMRSRGIQNIMLLEGGEGVPPAVYGEVLVPGAVKTIIFYAHYDGQPVNVALWAPGLDPFQPVIVPGRIEEQKPMAYTAGLSLKDDYRIYARGASDDKGGVMAILAAYEAIKANSLGLSCNIKFFFDGEEEQGSPHLQAIVEKYKSQLKSDLWIICDGPVHTSGRKQVVFGVRGDTHLTLKVYGPKAPLHSGHYGNWVPNPVMTLTHLLASMKNDKGEVTVARFYDDVTPLTPLEKKSLNSIPDMDAELKRSIGFTEEEVKGRNLVTSINLPSLNINGIESSNVGTISANVIPISATAVIDMRLVLGNDWQRQQQKLIDHIKRQGFYVTENKPIDEERSRYPKIVQVTRSSGYNAQRTSMNWPIADDVVKAVQATTAASVLRVPTLGGSLPLYVLEKSLNAKTLIVPIANPDNNQHAENENIRIGHFREGIDIMASLMLMKL